MLISSELPTKTITDRASLETLQRFLLGGPSARPRGAASVTTQGSDAFLGGSRAMHEAGPVPSRDMSAGLQHQAAGPEQAPSQLLSVTTGMQQPEGMGHAHAAALAAKEQLAPGKTSLRCERDARMAGGLQHGLSPFGSVRLGASPVLGRAMDTSAKADLAQIRMQGQESAELSRQVAKTPCGGVAVSLNHGASGRSSSACTTSPGARPGADRPSRSATGLGAGQWATGLEAILPVWAS